MPSNTKGVKGGTFAPGEEAALQGKKKFDKFELEQLWVLAGGNPKYAELAAAVSLAENPTGNPKAENHNTDGSIDRGLWQINSTHGAQSTFDPLGNAEAAVAISSGGKNWNPWTTFKNGEYKKHLGPSQKGKGEKEDCVELLGQEICGPAGEALKKGHEGTTAVIGWAQELAKVLSFLGSGAGWTRVLKVVGGGVLILFAASEMAKIGSGSEGTNIVTKASRTGRDLAVGGVGGAVAEKVRERAQKAANTAKEQTTEESE